MDSYSYIIADAAALLVWLALFLHRKDLRREMLTMSLIVAPMGPLSELFYLRDYWHPVLVLGYPIGIEDILFAFAIGGIAAVAYEELWRRHPVRARRISRPRSWSLGAIAFAVVWMYVGSSVLGFNSIYTSISVFLILGVSILYYRRDLLQDALVSGLLVAVLLFVCELIFFVWLFPGTIERWWDLSRISGVLVFGVPLEEILWGFSWGFVAGPAYEFLRGLRLR